MESGAADRVEFVRSILREAARAHERGADGDVSHVVSAADVIIAALRRRGKVLIFGNGGSAADAQHFAAELMGRFLRDRPAFAALALTTDTSVVTSVSNDYGFERVFARQIEGIGTKGDVAVAISTSGASPNILAACDAARARGLTLVAITGRDGGPLGRAADIHVNVSQRDSPRIQEVHRTIIHAICDLVERALT